VLVVALVAVMPIVGLVTGGTGAVE
jgi:hypothetical protein